MPETLYHYTCDHRINAIRTDQHLKPNPQPILNNTPLIWATDLDEPIAHALGLTKTILKCDRTTHRITTTREGATPWHIWARTHHIPATQRHTLEIPGTLPMHWWISETTLPVLAIR